LTGPVFVLDANVAVLLVAGAYSLGIFDRHKALTSQGFDGEDYRLLGAVIASGSSVVFCPHVLTETSNLIRMIGEPDKSRLTQVLRAIIERTSEESVGAALAVANPDFGRLGLTDAVLLELTADGRTLLTADAKLYAAAVRAGREAINFTHIRAGRPDFGWR
jgi:predicted nucleic acid-binding protein